MPHVRKTLHKKNISEETKKIMYENNKLDFKLYDYYLDKLKSRN